MRCVTYLAVLCGGLLLLCGAPIGRACGQNLRGGQNPRGPEPAGTVISGSWVIEPGVESVAPPRMVPVSNGLDPNFAPVSQLPPTLVGRPVVGPTIVDQPVVGQPVVGPTSVGSTVVGPTARQVTAYRVYPSATVQARRPATAPAAPAATRPTRPVYLGRGLIGQPKLYVEGQPFRNALRFLTP